LEYHSRNINSASTNFMTEQLNDPEILRHIPIFNSLSDSELTEILRSPENSIEEFEPKEVIIRESEIGDCMYEWCGW